MEAQQVSKENIKQVSDRKKKSWKTKNIMVTS